MYVVDVLSAKRSELLIGSVRGRRCSCCKEAFLRRVRQFFRHPISWIVCALVSAAFAVFARSSSTGQSHWEVLLQWHQGPPLVALILVGSISEILFTNGRMRRKRALILLPVAIFQLHYALLFYYAPDPMWLPGIASAALILVAAVVALEKRGPEMSS
jgi:peptidoglycan/LPS O-acetylase OafA/YrhL